MHEIYTINLLLNINTFNTHFTYCSCFDLQSQILQMLINRCEAFSTYPRTYDLLHSWALLSDMESQGCGVEDLLIEMDRMLRPDGFVIIRDKPSIINYVKKFLAALRWDGWVSEVEPRTDALSSSEERVLIARKKLWNDEAQTM